MEREPASAVASMEPSEGDVDPASKSANDLNRGPPPWVALLALVIAIGGAAAATVGAAQSAVLLICVGLVVAVGGLWWWNRYVRKWAEGHRRAAAIAGGVVIVGGLVLLWQALDRGIQWLAIAGVAAVIFGALPVLGALRHLEPPQPSWWIAGGLVVAAVGVAIVMFGPAPVGIVVALIGLAAYKAGLTWWRGATDWRRRVGPIVAVVGGAVLVVASYFLWALVAGIGVYLLVAGLLAASVAWTPRPTSRRWIVVLGALATSIGALVWFAVGSLSWPIALAIAVILVAFGASFVINGESLLFLTLAGIAVIWVSLDRVDESSPDRHPNAAQRIVALGDSYISGEGAETYYEGTNEKGTSGDQCRRSPTAYPVAVADGLQMGLDFLACSGAKTISLDDEGVRLSGSPNDLLTQLANAESIDKEKVRIVLVSIGGNDASFGDIGKACLVPGSSCSELRQLWLENVGQIGVRIANSYTTIKEAFPNASVVVVPYPLLIASKPCQWSGLDGPEHAFLAEFIAVLDDRVRASAAIAGAHYFDPALFAFDEEQICDGDSPDDSAMNLVNLNPVNGTLTSRLNPTNWFHGSLHPKPSGHELVADLLVPYLTDLLDEPANGPVNPEPDPRAAFELRGLAGASRTLFDRSELPPGYDGLCTAPVPFAARAQVVDDRAFVPLDSRPQTPVCFTKPDGSWVSATPQPLPETLEPDAPPIDVGVVDGAVRLRPQAPESDFRQYVLYEDLRGQPRMMLVDFCDLDPSCEVGDVERWRNERTVAALRLAAIPAVLLFLGGWSLALVLTRWNGSQPDDHRRQ
jgi:lysophospholipase L1-like esterase/uncharacterized membrane protein HdeD (DUF308 family)